MKRSQSSERPAAACTACAGRRADIEAAAADAGFPFATVDWVSGALTFAGSFVRKGAQTSHVDAAEICRRLVADLPGRNPAQLRSALDATGIRSSRDIGRIVYSLVAVGRCQTSASDSEDDFASIFGEDEIDAYVLHAASGRARDWPVVIKPWLVGALCAAGTGLVVAGAEARSDPGVIWFWAGSALLTAGWLLSSIWNPAPMRFGMPWSKLKPRENIGD